MNASKWKLLLNNCHETVSGHLFAICIFIFHKTEVQTVILRCLTGLNCNWFKSYGLRCSRRLRASSVNFWKMSSDKWPLYDHIWPFFRNYMIIFDKTEIHTVILRCWTSLYLNWNKSYDTKPKNTKNANISISFLGGILYKNRYLHLFCFLWFCVFGHNLCTN